MSTFTNIRRVAFDLETTGVDPFTDRPVSFGFVERASEGRWRIRDGFVNPGRPIPAGATAVHGIRNNDVIVAPPLDESMTLIRDEIREIWASGGVIVGMNIAYDLTMVDATLRSLGLGRLDPVGPVVDVLVLDRHFDKWRRGSRRLEDLCRHYHVTLEGAHAAVDDARACLLVFESQLLQYDDIDAVPLGDLTPLMSEWHHEWLADFSNYLVRKGETPISPGRFFWPIHRSE